MTSSNRHDSATDPLGEVLRHGNRIGVRYVRHFPHPAERVWRALTQSDQLRYWLPCDIVGELRPSAPILLRFWPAQVEKYQIEKPEIVGRVTVFEPPSVFEWIWDSDVLRFELAEADDGTTLTFTTWPEPPDPDGLANAAAGYHVCLEALRTLLDTGSAPPLVDGDGRAKELTPVYAQAITRSAPTC